MHEAQKKQCYKAYFAINLDRFILQALVIELPDTLTVLSVAFQIARSYITLWVK